MAYKDILVQLQATASEPRYAIGAELAARGGGKLTGVYLKTTLINQYNNIGAIGYLPSEELNGLIRENNESQDKDAAAAADALRRIAGAARADCGWRVIGGDTPNELITLAQTSDLVILPPPLPKPAYSVHASAIDICLAGCPVLLTPDDVARTAIGETVLLAWNGSREAARALRDALPLLAPGARVEVRVARSKDGDHDDGPNLKTHLERHGFVVNLVEIKEGDGDVATWLMAEAADAGCDLIVMGLYGHTRLREFVMGGVSQGMLHRPTLPLLMSH